MSKDGWETDHQNNENSLGCPQEAEAANALEKVTKQLRSAVIITVLSATLHVFLGVALTFSPRLISGAIFNPASSFGLILSGLACLWLTFGMHRRSRVCAVLATIIAFADSVHWRTTGLFASMSFGANIMQGILIVGLCMGLISCFKYHALTKKHEATLCSEQFVLIQERKPKTQIWQIIVGVVIGCIGIGTLAYGIATSAYDSGHNFDNWNEHSLGAVTIRVPPTQVVETAPLSSFCKNDRSTYENHTHCAQRETYT